MDQSEASDSDQMEIIPIPHTFLNEPGFAFGNFQKLAITQFLEAYYTNPSQYENKKPIDLIHRGWVENYENSLLRAVNMGSIQFYQFIIDTGVVGEISNRSFLTHCFPREGKPSSTFLKYLFNLCPNRINLIPPNILLSLLLDCYDNLSFDVLNVFWAYCPQLKNQNFLNSKIKIPPPYQFWFMIDPIIGCITDGGYNGDLSTQELEDRYGFCLDDKEVDLINLLASGKGSLTALRFFIENSDISIAPLYRTINSVSESQADLALLDDISDAVKRIFRIPNLVMSSPPPSEDIVWYLNWWEHDVLGNSMPLNQFKTFIFSLFSQNDSIYWKCALPLIEYLGDDFFCTLPPDQIPSFLIKILENTDVNTYLTIAGPDYLFPLINTLLSFPSIINIVKVKDHCIHFARDFLHQIYRWDCAELFLKLGGLTMEHIWSNHSYDDNNDEMGNDDVFTLKTLISSSHRNLFILPPDLVNWLSYQSGTQEQLIKLIKSNLPLECEQWVDVPESLRRLLLFIDFYYQVQFGRQRLRELHQELHTLQPRLLIQLNPILSFPLQSMSWLQSLIVFAPIDYMNIKLTPKLWKNPLSDGRNVNSFRCDLVGEGKLIALCHLPILMDSINVYDTPVFLLEDIIQGVITALLTNDQENAQQE